MWAQLLETSTGTQPQQEAAKPARLPVHGTHEACGAGSFTVGTGQPDIRTTSPPCWGHHAMLQRPR